MKKKWPKSLNMLLFNDMKIFFDKYNSVIGYDPNQFNLLWNINCFFIFAK